MKFLFLILFILSLFNIIMAQKIEIFDISSVEDFNKDKNASYGYWDNRQNFHFYYVILELADFVVFE